MWTGLCRGVLQDTNGGAVGLPRRFVDLRVFGGYWGRRRAGGDRRTGFERGAERTVGRARAPPDGELRLTDGRDTDLGCVDLVLRCGIARTLFVLIRDEPVVDRVDRRGVVVELPDLTRLVLLAWVARVGVRFVDDLRLTLDRSTCPRVDVPEV